jgi:hypothetical protein
MVHIHILVALLEQAHALQDDEHQVSYAHQWTDGVYAQVMAIGQEVHVWTIGTMLPDELPLVTNDDDTAAAQFEMLVNVQDEVF